MTSTDISNKKHTDEAVDSKHQEILTALKAITNVPIPNRSDPQAKNVKKKQRRFQRDRNHQSKS